MKSKKREEQIWYVFCLFVVLSFLLLIWSTTADDPYQQLDDQGMAETFNSGWLVVGEWNTKQITLPTQLEDIYVIADSSVILKNKLPQIGDNLCLEFRTSQQSVEIKIGNEKRYEYVLDEGGFFKTAPSAWHFVPIYPDDSGQEVTVSLQSSNSIFANHINEIHYGTRDILIQEIFREKFPHFLLAVLFMASGFFCFICYVFCRVKMKRDFKQLNYLSIFLLLYAVWSFAESQILQFLRVNSTTVTMGAFIGLLLSPVAFFFFLMEWVQPKQKKKCLIVIIVFLANFCLSFFLHFAGIVDFFSWLTVTNILIVVSCICAVLILIKDYTETKDVSIKYLLYCVFIVLSGVGLEVISLQTAVGKGLGVYSKIALLIAAGMICYINIKKISDEWSQSELLKKQLAESRTAAMLSKISPHFIYNTLTSIQALIDIDAKTASEVIGKFSQYLRINVQSLESEMVIAFKKEMDYVMTYLEIEKLRFGKKLNIVYHLEEWDFLIPLLTVQPIVENAVKHGICKKKENGTVTISTKKLDGYIYITVEDDGVGYDVHSVEQEKSCFGTKNVQYRLASVSEGEMTITSAEHEGTKVVIKLKG